MAKSSNNKVGAWAFLVGLVLAIIMGIFGANQLVLALLVIIGIVVGILNVTVKETSKFLLAGAVLVIVSSMGQIALSAFRAVAVGTFDIGGILANILNALLILFVPTTIIVALKSVFEIARD
jgi:uncharacterized membrane protein